MDNERSITIVYQCGAEVERQELKGTKVGYFFDHENNLVRIFADSSTVIVLIPRLISILHPR